MRFQSRMIVTTHPIRADRRPVMATNDYSLSAVGNVTDAH